MARHLIEDFIGSPSNISFKDLVKAAEELGWDLRGRKGSHNIFVHPQGRDSQMFPRPLNLQRAKNGKAKPEQVKEVWKRARDMGLIERKEEEHHED